MAYPSRFIAYRQVFTKCTVVTSYDRKEKKSIEFSSQEMNTVSGGSTIVLYNDCMNMTGLSGFAD
jgi:hypothetical protein